MYQVVLHVRPPSSWALDLASKHDVPIVILDCIPHGASGAEGLIEVNGDQEIKDQVVLALENHPDILGLHLVDQAEGKLLASVLAKNWVACSAILKSDCYLSGARTVDPRTVEWRLLAKDERGLARLQEDLELAGCQVEIRSKRRLRGSRTLTTRQEEVMAFALEKGYYDFPRRITAKHLAKGLGIAPSTLSEILQRSERKLVEFYLRHRL